MRSHRHTVPGGCKTCGHPASVELERRPGLYEVIVVVVVVVARVFAAIQVYGIRVAERESCRERMKERKSLDTLADRMIRISRVDFSLAKSRAVFCVSSL